MTGWDEIQNGWGEIQTPSGGSSLPDLTGNTGKVLTVNAGETGTEWAVGPAPAAAGSDTQVLFNDGGAIAGDAGLTFDKTTNGLSSTGPLTLTPGADIVPLTARAFSSGTNPIAQFQTSANGALSNIGHDGVFNGDVVGNVTGNVSGTSGSTTGNAATATAVASVVASKLVGRGSAAGDGASQDITVGTGLAMTGTTLSATGGGGGITNSAGANVVVKSDGTNVVATALSEASAGAFATSAGTALGFTATAPAATTGASQAGIGVGITASPAVASTDTAGAAAGGNVTITAGAAARNTSGNAQGGDIVLGTGSGIGTGTRGIITGTGGVATRGIRLVGDTAATEDVLSWYHGSAFKGSLRETGVTIGASRRFAFSSSDTSISEDLYLRRRGAANPAWGLAAASPVAYTHSLAADSRSGTDTDVSGATATLQPGIGTGLGNSGNLVLSVAPKNAATGTTANTPQAVVTLAPTATTITVPTSVATTGASVAGNSIAITASPAVASTDTAGAAAGGSIFLTPGNAARNASGAAPPGDVIIANGTGVDYFYHTVIRGPGSAGGVAGLSFGPSTEQAGLIYGHAQYARVALSTNGPGSAGALINSANGSVSWTSNNDNTTATVDTILRRRGAANPAWGVAAASPVAYTHSLAADARAGTDTNTRGANADLAPGNGTGTAGSGQMALQTAYGAGTGTAADTFTDRVFLESVWTDLTESAATNFSKLTYDASTAVGGEWLVTISANDGTEYQSLTSRVRVSSVRKATGNTVSAVNVVGTDLAAVSSGTLTATFTVVEGAAGVTLAANAVSSLTQTVLRISYQAQVNGPGTVGAP